MPLQIITIADLETLAAHLRTRASRAPSERKPGLTARFLMYLDGVLVEGKAAPLAEAIAAFLAEERAEGRPIGNGHTPEASISAGVYTLRKARKLAFEIRLAHNKAYIVKL